MRALWGILVSFIVFSMVFSTAALAISYDKVKIETDYVVPRYSFFDLQYPLGKKGTVSGEFKMTITNTTCSVGSPKIVMYDETRRMPYDELEIKNEKVVWNGQFHIPGTEEYLPAPDGNYYADLRCEDEDKEQSLAKVAVVNNGYYANEQGYFHSYSEVDKKFYQKEDAGMPSTYAGVYYPGIDIAKTGQLPAFLDRSWEHSGWGPFIACSGTTGGVYCKQGDITVKSKDSEGRVALAILFCRWSIFFPYKEGYGLCSLPELEKPTIFYTIDEEMMATDKYDVKLNVKSAVKSFYKMLVISDTEIVHRQAFDTIVSESAELSFLADAGKTYKIYISALVPKGGADLEIIDYTAPKTVEEVAEEEGLKIMFPKTHVTTTSATVSWDTNVPADSKVLVDSEEVYRTALIKDHTVTIKNLTPGESYFCTIFSKDKEGNEVKEICDFTTPAEFDTTGPTISNIAATADEDTATITWTTDEPSATIIGVDKDVNEVQLKKNINELIADPTQHVFVDWKRTTEHGYTAYGLQSGTTYYYRIFSEDASGNERTTIRTFETLFGPEIEKKPNFIVGDIKFEPTAPGPGDNVYVTATVKNMGESVAIIPANQDFLSLYFKGQYKGAYKPSTSITMKEGESKDFRFTIPLTEKRVGDYSVAVKVNVKNTVEESTRSDNSLIKTLSFGAVLRPDLWTSDRDIRFDVSKGIYTIGEKANIRVRVRNWGSADVVGTGDTILELILDPKTGRKTLKRFTGRDIPSKDIFGNPTNGKIGRGQAVEFMWSGTFQSDSNHMVRAVIDPDNKIAEQDEGNNKADSAIWVVTKKIKCAEQFNIEIGERALIEEHGDLLIFANIFENGLAIKMTFAPKTGIEKSEVYRIPKGRTYRFLDERYKVRVDGLTGHTATLTLTDCPQLLIKPELPPPPGPGLFPTLGRMIFPWLAAFE